jgi:hypothetical protein
MGSAMAVYMLHIPLSERRLYDEKKQMSSVAFRSGSVAKNEGIKSRNSS